MTNAANLAALGSNGSIQFPSWTTAGRPTGVVGLTGFNTTLGVQETYTSIGWLQSGMYLTGSATISSGSPQTYIDIANCFNTTFPNYVVKLSIYNGGTSGGEILAMAFESSGASLSGGVFSGGTFPANYYWVMHYQETTNSSNNGNQGGSASTTNYPEIFGSTASGQAAGNIYFMGTLNLYDVYANTKKIGDAQGTMVNPTLFLEQSNFVSSSAITGRGLRFWFGNTAGTPTVSIYGTVRVYGVL
jgi:hypothetical protein